MGGIEYVVIRNLLYSYHYFHMRCLYSSEQQATRAIDHMILLKLERIMKVSLALNCCGINGGTIKVEAQNQRICFSTRGTNPVFDILQDLGRIDEFYIEQYVPGCPKSLFNSLSPGIELFLNASTILL